MNKTEIASTVWSQRKKIAEIVTTAIVIGKGVIDFARKDGIGKVFALAELGVGIGAAAIHTGAADKIVNIVAERKAEEDYRTYPPEEGYDPYEGLSPEPDPYDSEYDEYDDGSDDVNDENDSDVDEDGFDPQEFDKFINSGESTEYDDGSDDAGEEE